MSIESNKAAVRRFWDTIWVQHDIDKMDEFAHPNVVGNDSHFGTSVESFKEHFKERITAFPDVRIDPIEIVSEGDWVATRWLMTGTHKGEYMGVAATGKRVEVTGMSFDRLEDGRIIEGYDNWDVSGLQDQLRS
jgi:steroid delta-isomerase-like uncharacterized protein